jgi:hypothetical protein
MNSNIISDARPRKAIYGKICKTIYVADQGPEVVGGHQETTYPIHTTPGFLKDRGSHRASLVRGVDDKLTDPYAPC